MGKSSFSGANEKIIKDLKEDYKEEANKNFLEDIRKELLSGMNIPVKAVIDRDWKRIHIIENSEAIHKEEVLDTMIIVLQTSFHTGGKHPVY